VWIHDRIWRRDEKGTYERGELTWADALIIELHTFLFHNQTSNAFPTFDENLIIFGVGEHNLIL